MLNINDRPQWRVLKGGSRSYVEKIAAELGPDRIRLNSPVTHIDRSDASVTLTTNQGQEQFDQVILACHSDQALGMLSTPSAQERDILGAIPYKQNEVILHTDASILPKAKKAWASWNYHINTQAQDSVAVTYYMNRLQNFNDASEDFCVTLNNSANIDKDKIIRAFQYAHPVFTPDGMAAQQRHHEISNHNRTHYCGAYWLNGFHEDGVNSALRVLKDFGVSLP